ncbi:MAG: hypothetical protein U1E25_15600 [Methylocystis sp.]
MKNCSKWPTPSRRGSDIGDFDVMALMMARFELALLGALGFGLDLHACA